jgi:hypothetical protein
MPFRSGSSQFITDVTTDAHQPTFEEEYSLGGGTLKVGFYYNQGGDEAAPGRYRQTIGLWSNGRVGLCANSNSHGNSWVRDFFVETAPVERDDSVVLTGEGTSFDSHGGRILLTIQEVGLLELEPIQRKPSGQGKRVRAGEMYRTQRPGGDGIFLVAGQLGAHLHMLDVSGDEAARFVESFTAVDRAA